MKENSSSADSLFESVREFSITWIELIRLKTINRASEILSASFPLLLISILLIGFIFFINLGAALWIGDLLGRTYAGFLAVAGFYLFLTLFFRLFLHGWIKRSTANFFIRHIFRKQG